jgi:hypothetical protein
MVGADEHPRLFETPIAQRSPSPFNRFYLEVGPPRDLVAVSVQILMMVAAQWHGVLITDLVSERAWLRKFQVMRIAGRALADETGLCRDRRSIRRPPASFVSHQRHRRGCRPLSPPKKGANGTAPEYSTSSRAVPKSYRDSFKRAFAVPANQCQRETCRFETNEPPR